MNGQKIFERIIENLKDKYSEMFNLNDVEELRYKEEINVSIDPEIEKELPKYEEKLKKIIEAAIKTITETTHFDSEEKVISIKPNITDDPIGCGASEETFYVTEQMAKLFNQSNIKLEKQSKDYYDDYALLKNITISISDVAKIQINAWDDKIIKIEIQPYKVGVDKNIVIENLGILLDTIYDILSEVYFLEKTYEKKSITKPPTIITHDGLAHVDDLLAVAVLLTKYPDTTVIRKSEVTEEELNDDMTIVVDVGGRFEPENRNYDHHQNKELPSSLIMVLKYEFGRGTEEDLLKIDELRYIDTWDRFGPVETQKRFDIKLPEFRELVSDLVLRAFSKAKTISKRENIELYFTLLTLGKELLEFIDNYRKLLNEVKENSEVKEVKGLKVVKIDKPIQIKYIKKVYPDVAIVVQPNPRTKGAYSVIRIDDHPRVDFNRIKDQVPTHFIHPTGFMAVVDPEYIEQAINIATL